MVVVGLRKYKGDGGVIVPLITSFTLYIGKCIKRYFRREKFLFFDERYV